MSKSWAFPPKRHSLLPRKRHILKCYGLACVMWNPCRQSFRGPDRLPEGPNGCFHHGWMMWHLPTQGRIKLRSYGRHAEGHVNVLSGGLGALAFHLCRETQPVAAAPQTFYSFVSGDTKTMGGQTAHRTPKTRNWRGVGAGTRPSSGHCSL